MVTPVGMPYTLVRFLAAEKKKEVITEGIYSTTLLVLIISLIPSIILLALSQFIIKLLSIDMNTVIFIALLFPMTSISKIFLHVFRAFKKMKSYSFFTLSKTICEAVLISFFILSGSGIQGGIFAMTVVRAAFLLFMLTSLIHNFGIKFPNFSRLKEYLRFGLPTISTSLSNWIVRISDRYIIGILLGAIFVGFYNPGYSVGYLLFHLITPIAFVLLPTVSRLYDEKKKKEVNKYLEYTLKYFLILAIPAGFGISILAKKILLILTTSEIASEGHIIVPFVALSAIIFGFHRVTSDQILSLVKKTKTVAKLWITAAVLNAIINVILIPRVGIVGAAISTVISYSIISIIGVYYSFKFIRFNINAVVILKSLIASIIMSLAIIYFDPKGILNILVLIILSASIYFIIMILLKAFSKKELLFFKNLIFNWK
jgi:O-antigen/teichoic acid export membrane protein